MNIRDAGAVKRFHTVKTHGNQTIAEHSFYLCMILTQITEPSAMLLKAALYHDLPEVETGDVPATAKWRYPKLAEDLETIEIEFIRRHGLGVSLSDQEWLALKYADMGELVYYCLDQLHMGNKNMLQIAIRGVNYLRELPFLNQKASSMISDLATELEKYRS